MAEVCTLSLPVSFIPRPMDIFPVRKTAKITWKFACSQGRSSLPRCERIWSTESASRMLGCLGILALAGFKMLRAGAAYKGWAIWRSWFTPTAAWHVHNYFLHQKPQVRCIMPKTSDYLCLRSIFDQGFRNPPSSQLVIVDAVAVIPVTASITRIVTVVVVVGSAVIRNSSYFTSFVIVVVLYSILAPRRLAIYYPYQCRYGCQTPVSVFVGAGLRWRLSLIVQGRLVFILVTGNQQRDQQRCATSLCQVMLHSAPNPSLITKAPMFRSQASDDAVG